MAIDTSTVIVLMLASALAGALLGVLPEWRRLMSGELPIRKHLQRQGGHPSFEAELRCALCAGRKACARRATPLPDCPNAVLFRAGASGTPAAPRA
ncbi:MAG TPA: hypothetical protein VFZ81_02860 [Burkholderiales bacterium]